MRAHDFLIAFIRTVVPAAAGSVVAWAAAHVPFIADALADVSESTMLGFYSFLTLAAIGGYYALIRKLESRWPIVGVLLGWKASPTYDSKTPAA